jgi:hypothetical protein
MATDCGPSPSEPGLSRRPTHTGRERGLSRPAAGRAGTRDPVSPRLPKRRRAVPTGNVVGTSGAKIEGFFGVGRVERDLRPRKTLGVVFASWPLRRRNRRWDGRPRGFIGRGPTTPPAMYPRPALIRHRRRGWLARVCPYPAPTLTPPAHGRPPPGPPNPRVSAASSRDGRSHGRASVPGRPVHAMPSQKLTTASAACGRGSSRLAGDARAGTGGQRASGRGEPGWLVLWYSARRPGT